MRASGRVSQVDDLFFKNYVPQLERAIKSKMVDKSFDDPTIDLTTMELAIHRPSNSVQRNGSLESISNHDSGPDSSLEELEFLVETLKNKSIYSKKLISIMISGLQRTLGPHNYQSFLRGQLPKTWIPVVKMNNRNCPYIEFLIKSDEADEPPDSQLRNFSSKHMAFGQYVLNFLASENTNSSTSMPALFSTPKKTDLKSTNKQTTSSSVGRAPNLNSNPIVRQPQQPTIPSASVSRASRARQSTGKSRQLDNSLNDSKRIQPPRACRSRENSTFQL